MPVELALGLPAKNVLMRASNAVLAVCTRLLPQLLGYQFLFAVRPRARDRKVEEDRPRPKASD